MPGTFFICGAPRSGTTLMGHLIGAVDPVFALGEFEMWVFAHHHPDDERLITYTEDPAQVAHDRIVCLICKERCPFWNPGGRPPEFRINRFYEQLRAYVEKPWLSHRCEPAWIDQNLHAMEPDEKIVVVVHKSPSDFILSMAKAAGGIQFDQIHSLPIDLVFKWGDLWLRIYSHWKRIVEREEELHTPGFKWVSVPYTHIGGNTHHILSSVLGLAGIRDGIPEAIAHWAEKRYHSLGGNGQIRSAIDRRDNRIGIDERCGRAPRLFQNILGTMPGMGEVLDWLGRRMP